jgi:hypothetical protein
MSDFKKEVQSLSDAYNSMYNNEPESLEEGAGKTYIPGAKVGGTIKKPNGKTVKVEDVEMDQELIEDEYSVSVEDGIDLEEGKKKCKDGYKYDKEKKKCVKKKKKSSSSSKTTVVVKTGGRGGYYGGLYPGYGSGGGSSNSGDGESETESNGGGDGGGDGGGGGE